MFAMLNSSFNAYVYGYFALNIKKELKSLKDFWFGSKQRFSEHQPYSSFIKKKISNSVI